MKEKIKNIWKNTECVWIILLLCLVCSLLENI